MYEKILMLKMASKGQINIEKMSCVAADIQPYQEKQRPHDVQTTIQFCLITYYERCPVRQRNKTGGGGNL